MGQILAADEDGVYLLKFVGDVRVTLCAAIDNYIEAMFDDPDFKFVTIDLCGTDGVDSTALGIMAKLSLEMQRRYEKLPDLVCDQPQIQRILNSMGFDDVFSMRTAPMSLDAEMDTLRLPSVSETDIHRRVLEAHRVLMQLNSMNRERFSDLVATLEETLPKTNPTTKTSVTSSIEQDVDSNASPSQS